MGRQEIEALVNVLRSQLNQGRDCLVTGAWTIRFDKARGAFEFDKCEAGGYCDERPVVIALNGDVLDAGGPVSAGA